MIRRGAIGALFAALMIASCPIARADDAKVEAVRIPTAAAGPDGLEAIVVVPQMPGRHPLALVSHGSPRDAKARAAMTARDMLPQALEFARRGYVTVAVLRRGYGSSPGGWAEGYGSCTDPDYAKAGRAAAADLTATIASVTRRADVDAQRIVAVGVSAGGFATVALAADPPPGLVAAISFAGGRGSLGPDEVCRPPALIDAFRAFGRTSRVPMLWVYPANDHFFGPVLAHQFHDAFQADGGRATLIDTPAFGADGHGLFSAAGTPVWTPIVDDFLEKHHLPAGVAAPRLDPPRQLSQRALADWRTYLAAAEHKAFAVSAGGGYGWRTARQTSDEAGDARRSPIARRRAMPPAASMRLMGPTRAETRPDAAQSSL